MDQDLSLMDQSILPLHLRQGAIRSKEEAHELKLATSRRPTDNESDQSSGQEEEDEEEAFEWKDQRSKFKIHLSKFLGHEDGGAFDIEHVHKDSIMMDHYQFVNRIYPCAVWSFVVTCMVVLFVARFYQVLEPEGQRHITLKFLLQTEVKLSAAIAPAFKVASSLALSAQAGLINTSQPYFSLGNLLSNDLLAAPTINFVHVVGMTERAALVRPGTIHDASLASVDDRKVQVFMAGQPCERWFKDPVSCLKLNNSALIYAPRDAAAYRWQRPAFLTYDGSMPLWVNSDERINEEIVDAPKLTTFAHRLVAYVNASGAPPPPGSEHWPKNTWALAVEIALDLSGVEEAIRGITPEGGQTFLCTPDGTLLAGSHWLALASYIYNPEEGMMFYPRLWDLGLPWTEAISRADVAGSRQVEAWHGSDIVIVRPLGVGDPQGAGYRIGLADLRVVATAPRVVGTTPTFKSLIHGSMGFIGSPGLFVFIALMMMAAHASFMRCAQFLFDHWH